jgi:hypothetical protein
VDNQHNPRAAFHVARARLLVDALVESERVDAQTETTLRVIRNELAAAAEVLGRPPPGRMTQVRRHRVSPLFEFGY